MTFDQKTHDLLSAIDRIIEERENVQRIEREIHVREEIGKTVEIFAIKPVNEGNIVSELEKTAILARDEAQRLGYKVSRIRAAKDRRLCRQFDVW